ncbi:MAG TPA: HupE/UreJ family protein [Polyangiaceae bacterium]|nr:HupE/UreJ family protein [Polyangiaceae bacterium]
MTRVLGLRLSTLLLALWSLLLAENSFAHPINSASLILKEVRHGYFSMQFKSGSPTLEQQVTPAIFPKPCVRAGAYIDCGPSGMVGRIDFPWLEGASMRFMVEIEWQDGARLLRVVTASAPSLTVYGGARTGWISLKPIIADYTWLGVEHILTGFDHLLFVIALTLLVTGRRLLLATITAFTVAHSVTLAFTALGLLSVPTAPVEATIALSIVLVCAECLRPADSLTRRAPWLVAFAFGLLHGLGFASALLEIGLPEKHVPSALLCFNLGVELGQLAVIGVILALGGFVERSNLNKQTWTRRAVYAMGGVAAFWAIDRIGVVFSG